MSNNYTADNIKPFAALAAAVLLMTALPLAPAFADAPGSVADVVATLVADALDANLELEGAGAAIAQRLATLDQARARYLPALDLSARYSRADGGRTIDFPVGDLLNPVYASLNQSGAGHFAPVANQEINFQRTREQDTKVSLTQPLYDSRIAAQRAAAADQYQAASAAREALAGRLVRDMREAYYRWLQARTQIEIFDATLQLASENRRVNDSLFRNGKITRDLVYRAEADELEVQQSQLSAHNAERLAQSYVNLLRNAPFDRAIPVTTVADSDIDQERLRVGSRADPRSREVGLPQLQDTAVERRAELRQLDALDSAAEASERLARAAMKPQLAFALDLGTQGDTYGLGSDDRYLLASVILKFNLFAGGGDAAGIAGARAAMREARADRALQEQQIRFQVQQALQDLEVTQTSLSTAAKRVDAASGAFRIASRKRDLGQINQAEFVDARRQLTDAQLNLNVTRFAALSDLAELEYALGTGTHQLPPVNQP
jgi:outer membrane protein